MKIPSIDYTPLFTATNAKYGAAQAEVSAQQSQLIPESLNLQQKQLNLNKANLIASTVLDTANLGLKAVQTFSDIKDQADLEKAKTNLLTTGSQYSEMAMEAVVNNTTSVSFENGKADIQLSPELKEYQASKLAEIDASKKSKTVKAYEKQQLQNIFASSDSSILKNAAEKYLNDTNASFEMNAEISVANDIKAGSGYANGEALVNSRTDLSASQKKVALYNYQKQVDYGRADATVTTIAKAQGIGKALEYAQSLEGFTPEQVQTITSNASKASQSLTIAAQTDAQNTMATGLEAGQSPASLYQQIEQATRHLPAERKQAATDTARAAHIAWADTATAKNWETDSRLSYDNLKAQRASIDNGERSYIYEGIPATKIQTLETYDKALKTMEETGTKNLKQETVDNINAIVASAKLGQVTGLEAVTAIASFSKDNPTATVKAIDDIVSDAIPANLKTFTNEFINTTLPNIMLSKYNKSKIAELTPEQQNSITDAQMFAAGSFIDLALQSSDVTPATFRESMSNITRLYTAKEMDVLSTGTVKETTKGTLESAMDILDTFSTVDALYVDYKGNQTWATPEMENTFDQASLAVSKELEGRGIKVEAYMPMPIYDASGNPVDAIAKPVFKAKDAYYTFEGKNIMTSTDLINWQYAPKETQATAPMVPKTERKQSVAETQMYGTGGLVKKEPKQTASTERTLTELTAKTYANSEQRVKDNEIMIEPVETLKTNWKPISEEDLENSDQTYVNVVQSVKRTNPGRKE